MIITQKMRLHPVNAFAFGVINGDIYTSNAVKKLCKRHIDDLRKQDSPEFSSYFDEKRALLPYKFALKLLNVKDAVTGQRIPFKMLNWQIFLTGLWNGWRIKEDADDQLERLPHTRRYRKIFLISGKSSGKSPLAAFFAYWMMLEQRDSEGVVFASTEDQAKRIHFEMQQMQLHDHTEEGYLQNRFKFTGLTSGNDCKARIDDIGWTSKFVTTAQTGNVEKKSSPIINFIFAEEYHVLEMDTMLDVLEGGLKGNRHPLVAILSNAGKKRQGPCWELYKHSKQMLDGKVPNDDEFLPMIFEVEENKAKLATETKDGKYTENAKRYWPAANPSLGATIRNDAVIRLLNKGKKTEADQHDAYRLALSIWPTPGALHGWIYYGVWERTLTDERPTNLNECDLYLGLDLGAIKAFSGLAKMWYLGNGDYYTEVQCYTHPNKLLERAGKAQFDYKKSVENGELTLCGEQTQDYGVIANDIKELLKYHQVRGMAVDMQYMDRLIPHFDKLEITHDRIKTPEMPAASGILHIIDHPQGAGGKWLDKLNMDRSMTTFEQLVYQDTPKVRVKRSALLNWMLSCAEVRHVGNAASQRRCLDIDPTSKQMELAFNDGIIALIQASGLAVANQPANEDMSFADMASDLTSFYKNVM